jgi:adenylate cyclase
MEYVAQHSFALGHFLRGRYEEAANAGRRAAQSNPNFSMSQSMAIAPLVKLGRMDEARAAAARVLALQPSFSGSRFCAALAVPAELADPLTAAWRAAGLPD